MNRNTLSLTNGVASITFTPTADGDGWQPDWIRLNERLMLRFKDHEFLNVGDVRVTTGQLVEQSNDALRFGGTVEFAGTPVGWSLLVCIPTDGGPGFTIHTELMPREEPIELLEAMSAFETPYEYDGTEAQTTVMPQQPVYRSEGEHEVNGAGYIHPFWYYGHAGRAHLTYPSACPVTLCRVADADGGNARCIALTGNWQVCSVKDMFSQPTRSVDGKRGRKFLIGALNWNNSLQKDPNVLVEPGTGLKQEVTVDVTDDLPGGCWDAWLAKAWERACGMHFPADGRVPAADVAHARGAGWVEAASWLTEQLAAPEGYPGFFDPERGTCVYAPHTRPKWDGGVPMFAGQWTGPVAYLGHAWNNAGMVESTTRLERLFVSDQGHAAEQIWTIGPTPMYCAVMRKAALAGVEDATMAKVRDYVTRRREVVLNPPEGGRRGDAGILAWDAFANLLAGDLFEREACESAAREMLARVNAQLDDRWWAFNCAAEGDLVGAGQGRPFGHGIAAVANLLAWQRFGDDTCRTAAERLGNITMGLHFITHNESPAPDLDTRGWAHGSTGGRDQWAQIPPWETGFALQQLAQLIGAGIARDGFYDLLWLFAHTGLAQFPKARTMKRLYTPDMGITYRPIESLASERAFYLSLPYLAYENPWDQTMLAGYQGVEPIILSLCLGGGLVATEDRRVLALVPDAASYAAGVAERFTVHLWNPLDTPVDTPLRATVAAKRKEAWVCEEQKGSALTPESPCTQPITVPPRSVKRVTLQRG